MRINAGVLFLVMTMAVASAPARSESFGGKQRLDPAFCGTKAPRQTVIYVDDSMMVDGKTEWLNRIIGKLKASLAAGEKTTVVRLSPMEGKSEEVWSGCWPEYTPDQIKQIESQRPYILSKDPLETLKDQKDYFSHDLNAALAKIYFDAKKPSMPVVEKTAVRQILRSLASDEGRFSNSQTTVRVVMYSNMAENSDLGSVFQPIGSERVEISRKLGTHFRKTVVYAFGVSAGVGGGHATQENSKRFWSLALRSMSAVLSGFDSDLNIPNGIPVKTSDYNLTLKEGGNELAGRLSLLADGDGNVVDSWVGFNALGITGVTGTFHCAIDKCRFDGTTSTGLTTDADAETLTLNGKADQMSGEIGVRRTRVSFPLTAVVPSAE